MKGKILILGLICLFLIIASFGCQCNCDDDMETKRNEWGSPEETESYSESGYNSVTWWYWSRGISFTFKWGDIIEGCCDVSTYTFEPISTDSSSEFKAEIKNSKKFKEKQITLRYPFN